VAREGKEHEAAAGGALASVFVLIELHRTAVMFDLQELRVKRVFCICLMLI
jgi:hypothetical protein